MNDDEVKKVLSFIIKFTLAVGLLYWFSQSGKLDFKAALVLFSHPTTLALASLFIIIQIFLTTLRWHVLLRLKLKNHTRFIRILAIQWIGRFLSVVLPGASANDILKIQYIKSLEATREFNPDEEISYQFILTTLFLDRLAGFTGLLLFSGTVTLIYFSELSSLSPSMPTLILLNLSFLGLALFIYSLFFLSEKNLNLTIGKIPYTKNLLDGIILIGQNKTVLLKTIMISLISHFINLSTFHLINHNFYQSEIKFHYLMMLLPIGQLSTSLPISISGIGVGHLAYEKLFLTINQTNGATLFNNYWILILLMSLLGAIPFVILSIRKGQ